ncbi:MAG: hypothetical protein M3Y87_23915 [Myxococcota bacterium]|nr:hypothetical protein [Myxococcota bacterium]
MRAVLQGGDKSFVVFARGTIVIFVDPAHGVDLAAAARDLLKEWGPVHAGSPAGDFGTIVLDGDRGWAVTGHHSDILTLVLPDEAKPGSTDLVIGLLGRAKRDEDAQSLEVMHVEDRRR